MEFEQQIPLANLTWTSALPMSPSIAMNPIPSIGILNTMPVGDRVILSLRLQSRTFILLQMILNGMGTVTLHSELGAGQILSLTLSLFHHKFHNHDVD
jgi:hypothetical protein